MSVPGDIADESRILANWLCTYRDVEATFRAFMRETIRFVLWLLLIQRKRLRVVNEQDTRQYLRFLENVPMDWISEAAMPLGTPRWRPFKTRLSRSSVACAASALRLFLRTLAEEDILAHGPGKALRVTASHQVEPQAKTLSGNAIRLLFEAAQMQPSKCKQSRARLLIVLMSEVGLSVSEIAGAVVEDFQCDAHGRHTLVVRGRLNRPRVVVLLDHVVEEMRLYRTSLHLPAEPLLNETGPLIRPCTGKERNVSIDLLSVVIESLRDQAAWLARARGMTDDADALSRATAVWIRNNYLITAAQRMQPALDVANQFGRMDVSWIVNFATFEPDATPSGHLRYGIAPQDTRAHGWFITQWSGSILGAHLPGVLLFVFGMRESKCVAFRYYEDLADGWQSDVLVSLAYGQRQPNFFVTDNAAMFKVLTAAGARMPIPARVHFDKSITLLTSLDRCVQNISQLFGKIQGLHRINEINIHLDRWIKDWNSAS